jgi:hypothetical protein
MPLVSINYPLSTLIRISPAKRPKELAKTARARFDSEGIALDGHSIQLPRVSASICQTFSFVSCTIQCKLLVQHH